MRNIINKIGIAALIIAVSLSCADESLDPLQFNKIKKGTLLALRGSQLDAIYFDGAPYGAAFFANKITGNETFDYDAEFLSEDPNSMESFDIYVINRVTKVRVLLKNIPFSVFKKTEDYKGPWASISLSLSEILNALGANLSTPANTQAFMETYKLGIQIESDLNLTNGSKVLSADLVAAGLYESDQFYPAQRMIFGVEDIEDARPIATLSQRGQVSIVASKVVRTVVPLKSGLRDTLDIVFNQAIATAPTVSLIPSNAGTIGAVTRVSGKNNQFYVAFVAGGSYTGNAVFSVSGATSAVPGAQLGLVQSPETDGVSGIEVDNLPPQNTSFTTSTRLGKGQSATITLEFNEPIGIVPTVTIAPGTTGIDGVTAAKTVLSSDKLTATYVYEYKDLDGNATHGDAIVSIAGGKDLAGNDLGAIASKPLTIDIGAAPAPTIILDGTQYDWGTLIKWTVNYATGASNPGGSISGTVYYVAVNSGSAAPTAFVGGDVPAFTMATNVSARQEGEIVLSSGTTGSTFSTFTPNGTLDVYAVLVTSSGVISAITPVPTTVLMN
jgi:hypothetical protein